jgi:hypothetical protein
LAVHIRLIWRPQRLAFHAKRRWVEPVVWQYIDTSSSLPAAGEAGLYPLWTTRRAISG